VSKREDVIVAQISHYLRVSQPRHIRQVQMVQMSDIIDD